MIAIKLGAHIIIPPIGWREYLQESPYYMVAKYHGLGVRVSHSTSPANTTPCFLGGKIQLQISGACTWFRIDMVIGRAPFLVRASFSPHICWVITSPLLVMFPIMRSQWFPAPDCTEWSGDDVRRLLQSRLWSIQRRHIHSAMFGDRLSNFKIFKYWWFQIWDVYP